MVFWFKLLKSNLGFLKNFEYSDDPIEVENYNLFIFVGLSAIEGDATSHADGAILWSQWL